MRGEVLADYKFLLPCVYYQWEKLWWWWEPQCASIAAPPDQPCFLQSLPGWIMSAILELSIEDRPTQTFLNQNLLLVSSWLHGHTRQSAHSSGDVILMISQTKIRLWSLLSLPLQSPQLLGPDKVSNSMSKLRENIVFEIWDMIGSVISPVVILYNTNLLERLGDFYNLFLISSRPAGRWTRNVEIYIYYKKIKIFPFSDLVAQ